MSGCSTLPGSLGIVPRAKYPASCRRPYSPCRASARRTRDHAATYRGSALVKTSSRIRAFRNFGVAMSTRRPWRSAENSRSILTKSRPGMRSSEPARQPSRRKPGTGCPRTPRTAMSSASSKARRSSKRGTRRSASATRRTSTKAPCGRPPSR
jgi:hypothetical protein